MSRPIHRLRVTATFGEIWAVETAAASYIGFALMTAGIAAIFARLDLPLGWSIAMSLLLSTMFWKPWNRRFHVSRDLEQLEMRWWILGVLPLWAKTLPTQGSELEVDSHISITDSSSPSGTGCLAFLLPFPISLLLYFASSPRSETTHNEVFTLLLHLGEGDPSHVPLATLAKPDVADEFLAAVAEVSH